MISNRHPAMLGKPVRQGWSEVASLGPLFDSILRDGSSLHRFNERFFLNRDQTLKHPEENFQTWSLVPVEDAQGRNVGILKYVPSFYPFSRANETDVSLSRLND